VIGIDMNEDMLALARRHQPEIGRRIGWHNVEFRRGRIQDLGLDLEQLDFRLKANPIASAASWLAAQHTAVELRDRSPLVASDSIDVVLSNCVFNLVPLGDRRLLFSEIFRVLRPGGRAVISDIVSDQCLPDSLRNDQRLWSGCISGAFVEHEFLQAFVDAGFRGARVAEWQDRPWTTVAGIEFRSVTICAFKPPIGTNQEERRVVYRGPWSRVVDEDGLTLERGRRTPVSAAQFARLVSEAYTADVVPIGQSGPDREPGLQCHAGNCCGEP
jgi:SAM-dependent methyltransferase